MNCEGCESEQNRVFLVSTHVGKPNKNWNNSKYKSCLINEDYESKPWLIIENKQRILPHY